MPISAISPLAPWGFGLQLQISGYSTYDLLLTYISHIPWLGGKYELAFLHLQRWRLGLARVVASCTVITVIRFYDAMYSSKQLRSHCFLSQQVVSSRGNDAIIH